MTELKRTKYISLAFFTFMMVFIVHRLMMDLFQIEENPITDIKKYPGINIKEF